MTGEPMESLCHSAARLVGISGPSLRRLRMTAGDNTIEMEWAAGEAAAGASAPDAAPAEREDAQYVRAPSVGTFYHAPEPGASTFVEPGDEIEIGQTVGILETMKLMNPIRSDLAGRVREVLVPNGEPVEYDQPLIEVAPA